MKIKIPKKKKGKEKKTSNKENICPGLIFKSEIKKTKSTRVTQHTASP